MVNNPIYWEHEFRNSLVNYKNPEGLDFVLEFLNKKDKILDAGCGLGLVCFKLAYLSYDIYGIDFSEKLIKKCKDFSLKTNLCSPNKFKQGNIINLPFKDKSFDVYLSIGVIEHFKPFKQEIAIKEAKRILRVKGRIIIIVPNSFTPNIISRFFIKLIKRYMLNQDMVYQKNISTKKIIKMFEKENFKTIKCYNYGVDIAATRFFLFNYEKLLGYSNIFTYLRKPILYFSRILEKMFPILGEKTVYIGLKYEK